VPNHFNSDGNTGSSQGLGCVSNGTYVACTYGAAGACSGITANNTLVIYDSGGSIKYCSGNLFDLTAQDSVPIMDTSGDVIMADDKTIARIDYPHPTTAGGNTWMTSLPTSPGGASGPSFSPTLIDSGTVVVVATGDPGYISAYWADTGVRIASTTVTGSGAGHTCTCTCETRNTPAASNVSGTRFYVSMNGIGVGHADYGLLVALDLDTTHGTISDTWSFPFGGTSGASPAVVGDVIYFDGANQTAGFTGAGSGWFFAIEDLGSSYASYWPSPNNDGVNLGGNRIPASGSVDTTRSCVWVYTTPGDMLYCLDETNGDTDYSFNVRDISTLTLAVPASGMSLTQTSSGDTVMLLGVLTGIAGPSDPAPPATNIGHVVAIKLSGTGSGFSATSYWELILPSVPSGVQGAVGQFPLVQNSSGDEVAIFPTTQQRALFYWHH
jgi:hypothetical protein